MIILYKELQTRELREVTQDRSNTNNNNQMQYITEFRSLKQDRYV